MDRQATPDDRLVPALGVLLQWLVGQGYAFRAITPASHARVNARAGAERARSVRDVFGWSRPFAPALLPEGLVDALAPAGLIERQDDGMLRSAVRVAQLDGQLFAHSAYPTDAPDAVFFGPDTYRFARVIRAELQRQALPAGGRILDLGCGAGPGGIVAARASAAADAEVWLSDINRKALAFARANAAAAGCSVQCRQSDLLAALDGDFDLVVANPPFMNDPAGRAYRHGGGARGEGLTLRIVREVLPRLAPGGRLVLYTASAIADGHDALRESIAQALDGHCSWHYEEVDPDVFGEELESAGYADVDRIAAVALVAQRPADPLRLHLHPAMA